MAEAFGEIISQLMRISEERRATEGHKKETGDRETDKKIKTERDSTASQDVYMFSTCCSWSSLPDLNKNLAGSVVLTGNLVLQY